MTQLKNPSGLIIFSLFVGWLSDFLFYNKPLGLSFLIFIGVFSVGLWTLAQLENQSLHRKNLWLMIPMLFCATMVMLRANSTLTLLNVLISGFCLTLLAVFWTTGNSFSLGLIGFSTLPFRALGNMAARPIYVVDEHVDLEAVRVTGRDKLYPVMRGAVFAAPILFIFVGLLASADAVFAQSIMNVFDIQVTESVFTFIWRLLIVSGVSWLAIGYFAYSLRSAVNVPRPLPERVLGRVRSRFPLGTIESMTILVLINVLFGAFVSIQFAYLFGGQGFISLDGTSYAQYARRGFFELVTVACLTLLLIQFMNWFTVKKYKGDRNLFNLLSTLIIGFVIVMLISAFQRLSLYEWTFGFTQLRIYVHTFMVWMGGTLLWYLYTLWLRPNRFAVGALVCLFGFVISLNLLNPDAFIVRKNLERFESVGHLDLEYLTTLSADAVPQLITLAAVIDKEEAISSGKDCSALNWMSGSGSSLSSARVYDRGSCIESSKPDLLQEHLQALGNKYSSDASWQAWQAFHISHFRTATALSNYSVSQ